MFKNLFIFNIFIWKKPLEIFLPLPCGSFVPSAIEQTDEKSNETYFILFSIHEVTIRIAVLLLLFTSYIPSDSYIIIKKPRKIYVKSQEI